MAKSSRTFVCSSISQPKHLHLLTPITAQFAARARRAVRWRPPEPRSLVSSCSGVGRGAEAGCGVEVTVSSEDTEHLPYWTLWTPHLCISHSPAAPLPRQRLHCAVVVPVKFLAVRIFLLKLFG